MEELHIYRDGPHNVESQKDSPVLVGEAMMPTIHTLNHSPTAAVLDLTPHEAYLGSKRVTSHFHVFGCDAYVHVSKKDRGKMDPTSQKMYFVV